MPASAANAASQRNRPRCDQLTSGCAALIGPRRGPPQPRGGRGDQRGEVIVAYVVPRQGAATGDALVTELQQLVKTRLAAHIYPRRVYFVPELPKTPSGKIQRFLLRQRDTHGGTKTNA